MLNLERNPCNCTFCVISDFFFFLVLSYSITIIPTFIIVRSGSYLCLISSFTRVKGHGTINVAGWKVKLVFRIFDSLMLLNKSYFIRII